MLTLNVDVNLQDTLNEVPEQTGAGAKSRATASNVDFASPHLRASLRLQVQPYRARHEVPLKDSPAGMDDGLSFNPRP